ncbi:hypothetical protein MNBD_GAMMA11-2386 [hydrothermal vent metagenome]|uniref:CheW-like domain-containing protein n=1 Tax=hydrothermal vent metagenome TaxID=652676 RepID=A0A3B0X9Y8_9ZZZZ
MNNQSENWLNPEDALSRFATPQLDAFDNDTSLHTEETQLYGFSIGHIGFLIAQNTFSEIVKNVSIYPVPNTKNWMRGLINLRGNLVPVYDLSLLLGYSKEKTRDTNLLILGKDSISVGILINRLPKHCNIAEWDIISDIPEHLSSLEAYVIKAYSSDEKIWLELNHSEYFKSIKEQIAL